MTKVMVEVGITQAFTSYNNPKGNADTERMMRTLKEELLWLREWTNPVELEQVLASWIECYTPHYFHSALGYKTPSQWERDDQHSHRTQSAAA
ncbi:MAG: integrase core domain-containing protein [Nitrospirota bacterium]